MNAVALGVILPPPGEDAEYVEALAEELPLQRVGGTGPVVAAALLFQSPATGPGQPPGISSSAAPGGAEIQHLTIEFSGKGDRRIAKRAESDRDRIPIDNVVDDLVPGQDL